MSKKKKKIWYEIKPSTVERKEVLHCCNSNIHWISMLNVFMDHLFFCSSMDIVLMILIFLLPFLIGSWDLDCVLIVIPIFNVLWMVACKSKIMYGCEYIFVYEKRLCLGSRHKDYWHFVLDMQDKWNHF